jgi:uncharacterized membrane protein YphA (DoxX/SURF4 family)
MFQKIAPLIVLALFVLATIFIMRGLEKASAMTHPQAQTTHQQGE